MMVCDPVEGTLVDVLQIKNISTCMLYIEVKKDYSGYWTSVIMQLCHNTTVNYNAFLNFDSPMVQQNQFSQEVIRDEIE